MPRILIFGLILLTGLMVGCNDDKEPDTVVLYGAPETLATVKEWLAEHPEAVASVLGLQDFIIKFFEPEPQIEHKIKVFNPNPNIDFKIRVISPSGIPSDELAEKLSGMIREQMHEQPQKPEK